MLMLVYANCIKSALLECIYFVIRAIYGYKVNADCIILANAFTTSHNDSIF